MGRLSLLDGLRGIAAIGVLLYHMRNVFGVAEIFSRSYLFVDVFFVLSGFVLTLAAERKMEERGAVWFMEVRVKRLWPMIALGSVVGALGAVTLGEAEPVPALLVLALAGIPILWREGSLFPLNGPQWSLFWEIVANVAHVLVLRRLSDRTLLFVAAFFGVAFEAAIWKYGSDTFGPNQQLWWLAGARVGWSYTIGIWMARRYQKGFREQLVPWWFALALPVALIVAVPLLPWHSAVGDALVAIVLLPPLFWLVATATPAQAAVPWLDRLGALSFPLYAVHLPIMVAFLAYGSSAAIAAIATVTSLSVAALVTWAAPLANDLRRRLVQQTAPAPLA